MLPPFLSFIIMDTSFNLGAPVQGAFNLISTLITNRQRQNLVEEQNRLNLEQWNRQNVYDSPVEQMKRLEAAGLNPNLIYGQMSNGSSASPAVSAADSLESPQMSGIDTMLDMDLRKKQLELMQSEIDAKNENLSKQNEVLLKELGVKEEQIKLLQSQQKEVDANAEFLQMNSFKLSYDARSSMFRSFIDAETWRDDIQRSANELKVSNIEAENAQKLMYLRILGLDRQADLLLSEKMLNYSKSRESRSLANQADEISNYYSSLAAHSMRDYRNRTRLIPAGTPFASSGNTTIVSNQDLPYDEFMQHSELFSREYKNTLDAEVARLSQKYGDVKQVMQLILMGSQSLNHVSDAVRNWIPSFGSETLQKSPFGSGQIIERSWRGLR